MNEPELFSNVLIRQLTTLRVGGSPLLYVRPRTYGELARALERCRGMGLPVRIMGGGSNLLVDDGVLPFAVVHLCSPGFDWIERLGPTRLRVGAGVRLANLLNYSRRAGLSGVEFLAGIPGTLGGALAGNTGAWNCTIGERVRRAWVLAEDGGPGLIEVDEQTFGYRASALSGRIITEAELELEPGSPERIAEAVNHHAAMKAARHPMASPSAGCIFKNPAPMPAGKLLDLCGLKGRRVGGAEVSPLHANFICNVDRATSRDVAVLIATMWEEVRRRFGLELELEVKRWSLGEKAA